MKITYTHLKRSRWNEICSKIYVRTPNTKLWKLVKGINKEQAQYEDSNTIKDDNGQMFPGNQSAAIGLAVHYQLISKLNFTNEDKPVLRKARNC
ncbi:hypothetical protein AVEN_157032-1 [Araneus ventricosus]|uniref:Uncharacterized protein n=1 Tax=Araneus ventricosus TaxID=182803 RepID=A0A4Y2GW20_ARAVE|nr:hypothetical protein AVEN_157032-1 [Araneus ventricosus]